MSSRTSRRLTPRRASNGPVSTAAATTARHVLVETLESRQLLSAGGPGSVTFGRGMAYIHGTTGDDVITVSRDPLNGRGLRVEINGFANAIDETSVKRLQVMGGDGNDRITIDQSRGAIRKNADISGGLGNDTVTGGSGDDFISGGRGNDVLKGSLGNDNLDGGISNDTLYGGDGTDKLAGSKGDDLLLSGGDALDSLVTGGDAGDKINTATPKVTRGSSVKPTAAAIKPHAVNTTPTGLTPQQVRTAYGFGDLSDASFTNRGAGQTIVIVDAYDAPTIRKDLNTFSATFGLPTVSKQSFGVVYANGVQPAFDSGWAGESTLDVEWAHAIAPEARIILVEAASDSIPDMYQAIDRAVELLQDGGGVVSMSFGIDEFFVDGSLDLFFAQPGTEDISWVASTGDFGYEINHPAVSPYVLAVGGTFLPVDAAGVLTGPEVGWSGSGGGFSLYTPRPSFQSGLTYQGIPIGNIRAVPDVAYNADPASGVATYATFPDSSGNTGWGTFGVGGTSAGAPQWAGLVALANEKRAAAGRAPIGSALPAAIYQIARTDYADNFNDITQGTNGLPAAPGADPVTGWGTPKASALIDSLAADSSTAAANLIFEAARLVREPTSSRSPIAHMIFGGTGFGVREGADFRVDLVPNASSGVSFDIPDPLVDDGTGEFSTTARVSIFIDTSTTLVYNVRLVGHFERRHRRDVFVGEFFAASSRGKIIYQGDKPAFYGTFTA